MKMRKENCDDKHHCLRLNDLPNTVPDPPLPEAIKRRRASGHRFPFSVIHFNGFTMFASPYLFFISSPLLPGYISKMKSKQMYFNFLFFAGILPLTHVYFFV